MRYCALAQVECLIDIILLLSTAANARLNFLELLHYWNHFICHYH